MTLFRYYVYTYICLIILSYILPNAYINAKVSTGFWYGDSRPPKVMIITIYLKTK